MQAIILLVGSMFLYETFEAKLLFRKVDDDAKNQAWKKQKKSNGMKMIYFTLIHCITLYIKITLMTSISTK